MAVAGALLLATQASGQLDMRQFAQWTAHRSEFFPSKCHCRRPIGWRCRVLVSDSANRVFYPAVNLLTRELRSNRKGRAGDCWAEVRWSSGFVMRFAGMKNIAYP